MKKVFLTRMLPDPIMKKLSETFELTYNKEDRVLTKQEIIEGMKGKDGLLCLLTDKIDEEIMDSEPNLRIISNYAVGFNNIKVEEATKRGLVVTNTPGVLDDTTADLAFALMMATARMIPQADKFTRTGKWTGWGPLQFLGQDIFGKKLGIVGLGRIGKAVGERARKGFGMHIMYSDPLKNRQFEKEFDAFLVDIETLFRESDIITIHCPLRDNTTHLIDKKLIGMMKPSSIIINTARGPIIDEKALIEALKEKRIFGAGLDVFETEPDIPEELLKLENVVLLPHIGSASIETRTKMGELAYQNLVDCFEDKRPTNLVNPEVWNKRKR